MAKAKFERTTPHVNVGTIGHGDHGTPFFHGYSTAALLPHHRRDGHGGLPGGVATVMPGDNTTMAIEVITPIAMEDGLRFAIREGGRTVGAGVVTTISQ
jgi:elongation factor Tu